MLNSLMLLLSLIWFVAVLLTYKIYTVIKAKNKPEPEVIDKNWEDIYDPGERLSDDWSVTVTSEPADFNDRDVERVRCFVDHSGGKMKFITAKEILENFEPEGRPN